MKDVCEENSTATYTHVYDVMLTLSGRHGFVVVIRLRLLTGPSVFTTLSAQQTTQQHTQSIHLSNFCSLYSSLLALFLGFTLKLLSHSVCFAYDKQQKQGMRLVLPRTVKIVSFPDLTPPRFSYIVLECGYSKTTATCIQCALDPIPLYNERRNQKKQNT